MATVNFYLKKEDKNGKSLVMMVYQDKGKKFKFSTRLKVLPGNWKSGRLAVGKASEVKEINCLLDGITENIKEIWREAVFLKKEYSISVIEKRFKSTMGSRINTNDFVVQYENWIEKNKVTKTESTIKVYKNCLAKLLEYANFKTETLSFENVNQSFYEDFTEYLIKEKNCLNNTVGKQIKTLKTFLNYCMANEIISNVNMKSFKVMKEDADIVYLTEKELDNFNNLKDLPDYLNVVKDSFCLGCFTGLRFSDIEKLKKVNIKGDYLELKTQKTKDFVRIPISDHAKAILNKYTSNNEEKPLLPLSGNSQTNGYLKELAELARIDDIIEIEKFSGSKKVVIRKPKYQLICTHTARRTFVTLSLEKGIRPEVIMEITGHKKYQTFKRYIKITDSIKLVEMTNVWNKPILKEAI